MAKKKTRRKTAAKKTAPRKRAPKVDSADGVRVGEQSKEFMEVGKEVVPGMRLRCICRGHTGTIGRIAWSPCGRFIASPSTDKTIRIWDANDGKCLAVLKGHKDKVRSVAWSPDGATLASGGEAIRLWKPVQDRRRPEAQEWKETEALDVGVHSFVLVTDLAWSPDGSRLAWGGGRSEIWNRTSHARHKVGDGVVLNVIDWSPDGSEVCGGHVYPNAFELWDGATGNVVRSLGEHPSYVLAMAWQRDARTIASSYNDTHLCFWDISSGRRRVLEGHAGRITGITFSGDGTLFASKADDGTVRIWRTDSHQLITSVDETTSKSDWIGLAFSPDSPRLASLGEEDTVVRIWDVDSTSLLKCLAVRAVHYTSAKIVLVGESNVGKSCLAMRLAENRYPKDHEHGTTHGMRFWPMEAEDLHAAAKPPEGQRRDVVLWDFGGQDEYQLVHQMFLHDTTLALVLIDPTRGRAAMDEAREWNKRLENHLGKNKGVKLLVGAKVDRKSKLIDLNSIEALRRECGFAAFLDLSAKTGRNTKKLRKLIADALDWDQMAKTSRPELFQHIRDDVERRRRKKEIVLTLDAFNRAIRRSAAKLYEEAAVEAVSDQLATQGIIVRTKLTGGDEALVLQLPVIERYAGSLIIAARNNPRGVPVLEERLLGSTKKIPLPGMRKKERLSPAKERMVLECIVELMIQHGICFRHGGLLVFPTLFPAGGTDREKLPHSVSLYYDFTGAIDNIYASLVSKLMVSEEFGEGRLQAGRVEFERGRQGVCGVRQIKRTGGLAHIDLFFSEKTKPGRRDLFTRFVEEHLRVHGVDIREHEAMTCKCGEETSEVAVHGGSGSREGEAWFVK